MERISAMKTSIESEFPTSTLNECSYDDSRDVYLIQNKSFEVYDYDDIVEKWIKHPMFRGGTTICSPDSIIITEDNKVFLIEFKNTSYRKVDKVQVRAKLYEFVVMAKMKYDFDPEDIKRIHYIIVCDDKNDPKTHMMKEGRCPPDLKILSTFYSLKVGVYGASVFNRKYSSILR